MRNLLKVHCYKNNDGRDNYCQIPVALISISRTEANIEI